MNMKTFVIGSALVALTIVAAAPAAAQQTSPTPLTGQPTAEDFQIHKRYIKAFDDYGAALENLGEKYQKVASTVAKTVKQLEAHELGK